MPSFRLFAAPAAAALALFAAFAAATPPAENNVARISDFIGTTAWYVGLMPQWATQSLTLSPPVQLFPTSGKTNVNSLHSNAVGVAGNVTGICGRKIRLYYKHKSVVAYIVDSCGPAEVNGPSKLQPVSVQTEWSDLLPSPLPFPSPTLTFYQKCGGDGNVILSRKAFGALANVDKGHIQLKKHWTFSD